MFNRKKRRPNNAIVEAAHPVIAGLLTSAASAFADAVEPPVHSALDHWVSISILFAVSCALFYASAQGWV